MATRQQNGNARGRIGNCVGMMADDRAGQRADFLDPWGNHAQVVDYRGLAE
jgi:hypothetical protein